MPRRSSRRRASQRYKVSQRFDMKPIASKVICNENNLIFKEGDIDEIIARYKVSYEGTSVGSFRSSNELVADEYIEQPPAAGLDEAKADTDEHEKTPVITYLNEDEETFDENMAMQDIAAPPALEEFDEQRQPQPDVVSFPNFTADPISMNLAHFARSTTRISGVENIALRMTSGMQLSSHLASAHFASPAVDPAVIAWSSPMPILNSYPTQTSSIANETQVQDSYYRPWQTSVTPRCTTGLQRQAAYSNVMGLPGPMGYDIGFGNTHAAGLQYQAGYIDSALRYRSGIGNASANWPGFRQQQMNIYQPMPNPWDLQRPRGFSRVETYNPNRLAMSNEVAGPSNTIISSAPDQRLQNFMFALGMIPTNPSDAVAKRFKLVDSPQNSRTRSGHPFGTQECVKKLVINDISTPGASCSITGDPVMRCQMCDEKIDPAVLKNADRRYCSDCWLYVYFWKTPE